MADVSLSPDESQRIDGILEELRPAVAEFFADASLALGPEAGLLTEYALTRMRSTLELSSYLRAVADACGCETKQFPGRGQKTFVDGSLKAWRDSYTPIKDPWRIGLLAERVEGGEKRVLADVAALEAMALDRMFSTFEKQCAELLGGRD